MATISSLRNFVFAGTLLGCTILGLYVGLLLHISIVYTHLFYLPIVLGGLWYPRQAIFPAMYLGILHLLIEYVDSGEVGVSVVARVGSFLIIALVIGYITGRIRNEERTSLEYLSSYAQRLSTPLLRFQSTFDGVRMSLGMNMDVERMREHGDVSGLIRALKHPSIDVRYQAADALGTLHDPAAVDMLAHSLRDSDCGVRWKAAEALGHIGSSALPVLIKALEDPSIDVRWRAVIALGDTGEVAVIPHLLRALCDEDRYVRGRAILALASFGKDAITALTGSLDKEDTRIAGGAIRALGLIGEPAVGPLVQVLENRAENDSLFTELEKAFIDLGMVSVDPLIRVLEGANDPRARMVACRVLGQLKDTRALGAVQRAQNDGDEGVKNCAREALARFRPIQNPELEST
jgi:HEAT repeat protein